MLVYIWVASPTVFLCHQQKNTLFGDVLILSVRRSALESEQWDSCNIEKPDQNAVKHVPQLIHVKGLIMWMLD